MSQPVASQLVQGYMNLKLGVDKVYAEMEEDYEDCVPDISLEEAINIIQRNERGRQGKQRARLVRHVRDEEKRQRCVCVRAVDHVLDSVCVVLVTMSTPNVPAAFHVSANVLSCPKTHSVA